ncbi:hypothetical protein BDSB_00295 [Burkholderia dolosa PC543]|nr:hypothetical protein BDSB_00295 [Burkholderia dolosa PC543]
MRSASAAAGRIARANARRNGAASGAGPPLRVRRAPDGTRRGGTAAVHQ